MVCGTILTNSLLIRWLRVKTVAKLLFDESVKGNFLAHSSNYSVLYVVFSKRSLWCLFCEKFHSKPSASDPFMVIVDSAKWLHLSVHREYDCWPLKVCNGSILKMMEVETKN
jgi:hypothetical protein